MPNQAYLLTPPGSAAIAVVRILGPGVAGFLAAHFAKQPRLGRAVHGDLRDGDRTIDDPVVVLVRADAADLNLHGGPWVVRATLELLGRSGFAVAPATPIPLPAEAVDADEEVEREMLSHLPLARTELAVRALLAQPAAWRALLAAPPSRDEAESILADRVMGHLLHPPRVAIVGAANVGKSTLANCLFGQERSIVADMPGTTRDWVGEVANLGGVAVMLVDTPGQRPTDDEVEQQAIERAREQIESADVVVIVLDASRPLDAEQRGPLATHPDAVVAVNKVDRTAAWEVGELAGREIVRLVATAGDGVGDLERAILRRLGCDAIDVSRARCWTPRQRAMLAAALPPLTRTRG